MDIETFRQGMSVVNDFVYLNHAANGPLHDEVIQLIHKIAEYQLFGDVNLLYDDLHNGFSVVKNPISKLINCTEDEIALTSQTAHGIALVLESLNWSKYSKKRIIIDDLEFTTNSFAYQQIQKKFGIKLHVIKNQNGSLDLDDYEKVLKSKDIKLVGISHVQFTNGFKTNIKKLHELTNKYGSYLLVDAIQSCGALQIDSHDADFIAVGSQKWCLGPLSTGFLYLKQDIQKELEPIFVSASSDQKPLEFVHHEFHPHKNANKFQAIFNPNFLALGKSIEMLNGIGISNIENKVLKLTDYLVERINEIPELKVDSNRELEHKSGIVRIITSNKTTNLENIVKELREKYKIIVSFRNKGLRVSPHFYNNQEEIDKFITVLKSILNNYLN